ncbi:hypothetical protein TNCV_2239371 [Trichonephila clavipes]|nr:hypothetical protein TNCV_2239371 [Trichonephila clavipes]
MLRSDEVQLKRNGSVSRHNCVYWAPQDSHVHVEQAVIALGLHVWCGLSSRKMTGPFFLESTVTSRGCLEMFETLILPCILGLCLVIFLFASNKMKLLPTTIQMRVPIRITLRQAIGLDGEVRLSTRHVHLIEPHLIFICGVTSST